MSDYRYIKQYGKLTPVRGIEFPKRDGVHEPYRTAELAIKQKIKVLKDFGVIDEFDPAGELKMREKLERAISAEPDKNFDRVLDQFASRLILEKLGG